MLLLAEYETSIANQAQMKISASNYSPRSESLWIKEMTWQHWHYMRTKESLIAVAFGLVTGIVHTQNGQKRKWGHDYFGNPETKIPSHLVWYSSQSLGLVNLVVSMHTMSLYSFPQKPTMYSKATVMLCFRSALPKIPVTHWFNYHVEKQKSMIERDHFQKGVVQDSRLLHKHDSRVLYTVDTYWFFKREKSSVRKTKHLEKWKSYHTTTKNTNKYQIAETAQKLYLCNGLH